MGLRCESCTRLLPGTMCLLFLLLCCALHKACGKDGTRTQRLTNEITRPLYGSQDSRTGITTENSNSNKLKVSTTPLTASAPTPKPHTSVEESTSTSPLVPGDARSSSAPPRISTKQTSARSARAEGESKSPKLSSPHNTPLHAGDLRSAETGTTAEEALMSITTSSRESVPLASEAAGPVSIPSSSSLASSTISSVLKTVMPSAPASLSVSRKYNSSNATPTSAASSTIQSTAEGQVPRAPSDIRLTGDVCGPTFSFAFAFTSPHPLDQYCEVSFQAQGENVQHSTNSSYSCASVNVTGLHLRTNYVVEVVAIGSDNRRSQPVTFNISTAQGGDVVRDLRADRVTQSSAIVYWRSGSGNSVYHVRVMSEDGTCVDYALLSASGLSASSAQGPWPSHNKHARESSCLPKPLPFGPFNGSFVIPDLQSCTTYNVTVCQCFCDHSESPAATTFITLSEVPTLTGNQIEVVPVSSNEVTVRWSTVVSKPVCGPVTYMVRLLDVDNNDTLVGQHLINVTVDDSSNKEHPSSYSFTGLHSDHQYKVQMIATTSGGSSGPQTSSVVRTQQPLPGQVESIHPCGVTDNNGTSFNIRWKPPRSFQGVLTGYIIRLFRDDVCVNLTYLLENKSSDEKDYVHEHKLEEDSCVDPVTSHGSLTLPELMITRLLPDTAYNISITAVSQFGSGPPKSCRFHTDVVVPSAPTNLRATTETATSVTLSWRPPVPRPGPTKYNLVVIDLGSNYEEQREPKRDTSHVCSGGYETSSCIVSGLLPYWWYNFELTASTARGESPQAAKLLRQVRTKPSAPGPVGEVHVQGISNNYTAVTLLWACPPIPQRNTYITGFAVRAVQMVVAEGNQTLDAVYVASENCNTNFSVTVPVTPEYQYIFQVLTLGEGYNATQWVSSRLYTAPSGPSDGVRALSVTPESMSMTVTWQPPEHPNGRLTSYLITLGNETSACFLARALWDSAAEQFDLSTPCDVEEKAHVVDLNGVTSQTQRFDGLTPESCINVTVTPYNSRGAGLSVSRRVCLEAERSEAVSSLSVTDITATDVTLTWTPPTVTNGHLMAYVILLQDSQLLCARLITVFLDGMQSEQTSVVGDVPGADCPQSKTSNATGAPGSHHFSVTVTHLLPDTSFVITVYPRNQAGLGQRRNTTVHTLETIPSAPRSPHVEYVNATTLLVRWDPPEPRPGKTNYTLRVRRASNNTLCSSCFMNDRTILLEGWSNTRTLVSGLSSGWHYSLTITASTALGSRTIQLSQTISMPESPPGKVQKLSILPVPNDYRKLLVTWDYPALMERHGEIVNFTVRYQHDGVHTVQCGVTECKCPHEPLPFCIRLDATPGSSYTVIVRANNQYEGEETSRGYEAKVGPPPPIAVAPKTLPSTSSSQSTLSVSYCAPCLLNNTNGEIIYLALLVCASEYCDQVNQIDLSSRTAIDNVPSWHVAKENNFRTVYRPTGDAWWNDTRVLLARGKRSAAEPERQGGLSSTVYVVGQDDQCASRPASVHCNGPLPAGRSFRVLAVSCTVASCTSSAMSQPAQTVAAEDSSFPTLTIIGSLMGATAGVLVVMVIIWCRRRHAFKRCEKEDEGEEEMTDMTHKRAVAMRDYEDRLSQWKAGPRTATGLPVPLLEQFHEVQRLSPRHSKQAAMMDNNRLKNRYANIFPYDHSRVKLIQLDDDITTDYINANYIPGYHSRREYIATQGPLQGTVDDFWRMVWEQRSPVIVMLSGLTEGRLSKVYKYYPDEDQLQEPCSCGMVTVTLKAVHRHEHYLVRTFRLSVGRDHSLVHQFFIENWKDFDANLSTNMVLDFVRAVRQKVPENNKQPIVVHCSAGVGRTGTWIAIDYFMHYIRNNPLSAPINIFDFVLTMRDSRVNMVQAAEQYMFIHDVVAELVRRKTEVDRYDEPVYSNQVAYSNLAYDDSADHVYVNTGDNDSIAGVSSDAESHKRVSPSNGTKSTKHNKETETSRM